MPKYQYDKLFISTYPEKIHFDPRDLRTAVEQLRSIPQLMYTRLVAETTIRPAGKWIIVAPAALKLTEIEGRTPAEVWDLFDKQIDEQLQYWTLRAGSEVALPIGEHLRLQ